MERRSTPPEHHPMASVPIYSAQRKLDLNAPLLSILRHAPLGVDADPVATRGGGSCEFVGLGSLRRPGAVPFFWEHSPGHPKAKAKAKEMITSSLLPAIPPPPGPAGRAQSSANNSIDQERLHLCYDGRDGGLSLGEVHSAFQSNDSSRQADQQQKKKKEEDDKSLDEGVGVKADFSECSESVEGDAFSDAADTFNPTEDPIKASVICNLDCHNSPAGHTDPHARDFIMRRFLPAAKAMAVEPPAASFSQSESINQKKFQLLHVGQIQRCSIPRSPVADRLANLTDKKVREDSEEEKDMEQSDLHSKGCGFLPFRLGVPLSSPPRSKSKSRLHFLQFSRKLKPKHPANLQTKSKSSVVDDVSESSGAEDEHENGGRERYGSQFESDKANLIGNGVMKRIMYSPQQLSSSQGNPRDLIHSYRNVSTSLPNNEKKGFLGLPKEVALALSKKQAYTPGVLGTYSSLSPKTQKQLLPGNNLIAKKNVGFGSPSTGHIQSALGKKLGKESRSYKASQSDLLEGDQSEETDVSSQSSDIESIYGDGSPRKSAETGETSTTDDKVDQVGKYCGNLFLHSENASSGVKALSVVPAQGEAWHSKSVEQSISDSKFGTRNSQKLSAQVRIEGDSPLKLQQHLEHSHKNPPSGELIPPLPKSPSQSWLWRAAPSPTSASLLGQIASQTTKGPGVSITKGAKWEALVKSGIAQPGHLRYSEELLTRNLSINAHSGPNGTL